MQIKTWIRQSSIRILDLLTLKKGIALSIHGQKIRMPGRFLGYFPRDYESDNFEFYRKTIKPGMVCLDIGAHIGVVAVYIAKKCGGHATVLNLPLQYLIHWKK